MQEEFNKLSHRVALVEDKITVLEKNDAVDQVHRHNVEVRLASIEGLMSKLVWLMIGALFLAFMNYVIGGGLISAIN